MQEHIIKLKKKKSNFREKPPTKINMFQWNQCDGYKTMNINTEVSLFCINIQIPIAAPSNITRQISEYLWKEVLNRTKSSHNKHN